MTETHDDIRIPDEWTVPGHPQPSIEDVDPERAREWLGKNLHNRNLRRHQVNALARDMAAGRWRFTGEPIKFASDGALLDGQHRLQAIVQSGVSLSMVVVRGLRNDAQEAMDTGARRTVGDALSLRGEKNSSVLASVASLIIMEGPSNDRRPTNAEIISRIETDPSIRMIVHDILPDLHLSSLMTPSTVAYAYWRLCQVDEDCCASFFSSLSSLARLEEGSPILALHHRLQRVAETSRGKGSYSYRQEALACVFHAWNAYRRGEKRTKIQVKYGPLGRVLVPEPV